MAFNIPAYLMAKNGNVPAGAEPFDIPAYLMAKAASGGIQEISGTLPLTVRSRASQILKNYRIYGTESGAGVETENGYKLPITVTSNGTTADYPIYIGDSKLGEEEYVDYESGKVYKRLEISGLSEPLCGIGEYKDTLDLSTGVLTRRIAKLVLTGEKSYYKDSASGYLYYMYASHMLHTNCLCSHLRSITGYPTQQEACSAYNNAAIIYLNFGANVMNAQPSGNTAAGLKEYISAQYAAGTPVTVWYVLGAPTTETITVPSGLIGTIEGYLVQDETPTPTNPIYPTSNGTKQQDNTYSVYTGITPTDPPVPLPDIALPQGTVTIDIEGELKPQATVKGKIEQIT